MLQGSCTLASRANRLRTSARPASSAATFGDFPSSDRVAPSSANGMSTAGAFRWRFSTPVASAAAPSEGSPLTPPARDC